MPQPAFPSFKDAAGPIGWIVAMKAYIDWLLLPDTVSVAGTSYTAVLADMGRYIDFTAATLVTFTIPVNATVNFPVNTPLECTQCGAGQIQIAAAPGVTLRLPTGKVGKTTGQWSPLFARQRAINEWVVGGDIV